LHASFSHRLVQCAPRAHDAAHFAGLSSQRYVHSEPVSQAKSQFAPSSQVVSQVEPSGQRNLHVLPFSQVSLQVRFVLQVKSQT
jgi:hypothetical protein